MNAVPPLPRDDAPTARPEQPAAPKTPAPRPARRRARRARRWLMSGVLLVAVAAAGLWVRNTWFTTAAPSFVTATVVPGDIEDSVLATGELRPAKLVAVGAQVSGRVTALKVAVGDHVTAGQLIAEIDSKTQANAVRTSEAQLAQVRAQLKQQEATTTHARSAFARQESMLAGHASSLADYDTAKQNLSVAEAGVEALKAQIASAEVAVETAKLNLGYTRITAPIDGTVLAVVTQQGQTVNASSATPTIVVLGQLDRMQVQTEISEADVSRVRVGMPVYFSTLGNPDKRYTATLKSIDPAPESITRDPLIAGSSSSSSSSSSTAIYYYGWFDVPNPDGALKTYMTAEVHIVLGSVTDVLTIPSAALGRRNPDGSYDVRVQQADGTVAIRKVKIGLDNKISAEVLSGLTKGEKVVTGGAATSTASSSSGQRIRAPRL